MVGAFFHATDLIKKLGIVIEPDELAKAINEDREKDTLETDAESDIDEI